MIDDDIKKNILSNKVYYKSNAISDLYSFKNLEELINLRPFINNRRFHLTSNENYEWEYQAWLTDVNSWPPSLLNTIIKKQVCYIADCSRVNKKINSICDELEELTGLPADAHIYFDLNKSAGHKCHWDNSSNMIVQVEGRTNFKVWDRYFYEPNNRVIEHIDVEPMLDVVMEPNDIIVIPKNMLHQAESITKRMSISFPMAESDGSLKQERQWISL